MPIGGPVPVPIDIQKAIREAGAFIACLSQISVQKQGYVQTEFRLALTAYGEKPAGAIFSFRSDWTSARFRIFKYPIGGSASVTSTGWTFGKKAASSG